MLGKVVDMWEDKVELILWMVPTVPALGKRRKSGTLEKSGRASWKSGNWKLT